MLVNGAEIQPLSLKRLIRHHAVVYQRGMFLTAPG